MNEKLQEFSANKLIVVWAGLTILLLFLAILVFVYDLEAKVFILLLNVINFVLFSSFALLRKKIEKIVDKLIEESEKFSFDIKYNNENEIGFVLVFLFIIVCIYIIVEVLFFVDSYSQLIKEDGIVEYSSALFWFLSAMLLCFNTIKITRGKINNYQLISHGLLILFFIVCAGEEISWGQRLLGIETPEFFKAINVQDEMTLHNIGSISVFSNIFFLITIVFFLIVPFLKNKYTRIKQVLYFTYFPIPNKFAIYVYVGSLCVWLFVGFRFGTLGFHPFSFFPEQYYSQMDDEIFEFFAAYSFLCFSIFNNTKEVIVIKAQSMAN